MNLEIIAGIIVVLGFVSGPIITYKLYGFDTTLSSLFYLFLLRFLTYVVLYYIDVETSIYTLFVLDILYSMITVLIMKRKYNTLTSIKCISTIIGAQYLTIFVLSVLVGLFYYA